MPNFPLERGEQKIELRQIVAGCSLCEWKKSTSVPANIIPESTLDKALMANLKFKFAKHNILIHNGQAEMTFVGTTL